jgi:cell wall-associated NlpC family hydrolase
MGMRLIFREWWFLLIAAVVPIAFIAGCSRPSVRPSEPTSNPPERQAISRMGYTIQAGAFANPENADRMTRSLQERGLAATYFAAAKGLYKVRFGNFATKESARARADEVRRAGIIEEFYIVSPEEYPTARRAKLGEAHIREELVRAARSFLGVPYLWGGTSVEKGFDCSGLTMTVYQLNGLDLPRTSQEQFATGNPLDRSSLEKGDLLFFSRRGGKVSHVGIYIGDGQFIHAAGRGKRIRVDTLSKGLYSRMYFGARSYL